MKRSDERPDPDRDREEKNHTAINGPKSDLGDVLMASSEADRDILCFQAREHGARDERCDPKCPRDADESLDERLGRGDDEDRPTDEFGDRYWTGHLDERVEMPCAGATSLKANLVNR